METTSVQFKNAVVAALNGMNTDRLGMGKIEPGEDDVVARALLTGLPRGSLGTQLPPTLILRRHHDQLIVEIGMVTTFGSAGSLMNCAPNEFLSVLFKSPTIDEDFLADRMSILRLFAHAYLSSPHTMDEFLANLIDAANAHFVLSHAVRDVRDGEVTVKASLECDYAQLPENLGLVIQAAIVHSVKIAEFVQLVREFVMPDASKTVGVLADAFVAGALSASVNGDRKRATRSGKALSGLKL